MRILTWRFHGVNPNPLYSFEQNKSEVFIYAIISKHIREN